MIHLTIGNTGHLLVIIAFVTAIASFTAYCLSWLNRGSLEALSWKKFARFFFLTHGLAVVGIVVSLFTIIYNHYYEYHYSWSHSSNNLPVYYMISCFWEGQEGSFLLWIFWHVLLGIILIRTSKDWEVPVMGVFAFVQAFLVSMILGVVIGGQLKIGSSPFMLMKDVSEAPIFHVDPSFIPSDGAGLNPLLQNYWMVIHPPTLFLGFALTLVTFSFAIAGILARRYTAWIQPALVWSHVAALILGLGIMMGAYWAYETLNFGGYWNWDPVENAVYIPWLVLVAAIHVMMMSQRSKMNFRLSFILVISTFILILYATFLTRSGILGESSVHSFTDLGLSGQLLICLLTFFVICVFLLVRAWKYIPTIDKELSAYSGEFWIFAGAFVLCLAAFQVIMPISIPVLKAFLGWFGIDSNIAPPADQVLFYTKWQLWFAVTIALFSGTGQLLWWKKITGREAKKKFIQLFSLPYISALGICMLVILVGKIYKIQYIVLLLSAIYAITTNIAVLVKLLRQPRFSGGAVAHIGVALMLIGILFSAGYDRIISLNRTGLLHKKSFSDEMNKENILLFRNEPQNMKDYTLLYRGPRIQSRDVPGYIDKEKLLLTNSPFHMIAGEDLVYQGKTFARRGDTIHVYNENTYYEIAYRKHNREVFTLFPRVQINPQMGLISSPDISRFASSDLYTHISGVPDPNDDEKWSKPQKYELTVGDTFIVNDYIAILDGVTKVNDVLGVDMQPNDVGVKAKIRVLGQETDYDIQPVYLIKNLKAWLVPELVPELGLKIFFNSISPEKGMFTFSVATSQKDWIILKAIEKPLINLLWIGTLMVCVGFGLGIYRRCSEKKGHSNI